VRCAIDYLLGRGPHPRPARLHQVTLALCAEMLVQGGLADSAAAARTKLIAVLDSGQAAERFARMVAALGGPTDLLEHPERHLETAPVVLPVPALRAGYVNGCDCRALGLAVVSLGGGRRRASDRIDFAVGLSDLASLGQQVAIGQPLALVHARTQESALLAVAEIQAAYVIGTIAVPANPVIYTTILPA
jgi:thymidine phosphorylase